MTEKLCKKCGQTKALTDYHRNKNKPDGRQVYCKPCMCTMTATHAKAVREKPRFDDASYAEPA